MTPIALDELEEQLFSFAPVSDHTDEASLSTGHGCSDAELTAALYAGPDGWAQRLGETEMYTSYALASAAARLEMRVADNPTIHFEIREDGVMTTEPAGAGQVRVAPWPPQVGELGHGLRARAIVVHDNVHDIEDARWSLRMASAPLSVRERAIPCEA